MGDQGRMLLQYLHYELRQPITHPSSPGAYAIIVLTQRTTTACPYPPHLTFMSGRDGRRRSSSRRRAVMMVVMVIDVMLYVMLVMVLMMG